MSATEIRHKPLALIAVETADESRCEILEELGKVTPGWKAAQESKDKAEEDLLSAQTAARERFPDSAYDQETSHALNHRSGEHERLLAKLRRWDSRKRSLQDKRKKMTAEVLRLVGELREPGLWAAGEAAGPDGWKKLALRVLCGGPDPEKETDKQDWLSRELEQAGYHTIGEFLKGRGRLIAESMDSADLAADTVKAVDREVYRFLDRKKLTKHWPKDIGVPEGAQLMLIQDDDGESLLDSVAPEPGTPSKPAKSKPKEADPEASLAPLAPEAVKQSPKILGPDLYDAATAGRKGSDCSKAKSAAGQRVAKMMEGWKICLELALEEDETVPEMGIIDRFSAVYGGSPAAMLQKILDWAWEGKPIPQSPVSEGTTDQFVSSALWLSDHLAHEAHRAGLIPDTQGEEVIEGWCRRMAELDEPRFVAALAGLEAMNENLAGVLRAHVKAHPRPVAPESPFIDADEQSAFFGTDQPKTTAEPHDEADEPDDDTDQLDEDAPAPKKPARGKKPAKKAGKKAGKKPAKKAGKKAGKKAAKR